MHYSTIFRLRYGQAPSDRFLKIRPTAHRSKIFRRFPPGSPPQFRLNPDWILTLIPQNTARVKNSTSIPILPLPSLISPSAIMRISGAGNVKT
ncbi:hypothetical protein NG799_14675 [Laspinema sp. D1]|uniref:Uncharacterized protein n=1 Tax=Laspinema palackyanum D2a TaxID=2953684 RepID=A0ABT2MVZ8_9CYAN|nr:hypothetical protein [Laspinema sp. D2a]